VAEREDPAHGPGITAFGDAAVLVTFGDRADPALAVRAGALAGAIDDRRAATPALGRSVPAHATVLVPFDPLVIDLDEAIALVGEIARGTAAPRAPVDDGTAIDIPVRYGGADGPDLDEIAAARGLRRDDVVELHAGAKYRVLFLGFAPGFAYLGGLPPALESPRRTSPRERVPAGSVAIAGEHTGVYPLAMPGGWNLIGRTDARLFDATRAEPALLRPGAAVRFVPLR
jgi:KipI family sensor histidine kinase inhibitor